MQLPKIRTMQDAYEEIKADDPNTGLSFYTFRQAILSGKIPSRKEGRIYLIAMNNVAEYLAGSLRTEEKDILSEREISGTRKIS
ncbi:MAG: hypothetical protein LBN12_07030 [Clostridiales Family XIII bacterium]|nr:hypothetical protein [Clostridiales Family XIII bacterium]